MSFSKELHDILPLLTKPLTVEETALHGCLPPVLGVDTLASIWAPDSPNLQEAIVVLVKSAIRNHELDSLTVEEFGRHITDWEFSRKPEKYREPQSPGAMPPLLGIGVGHSDTDIVPGQGELNENKKKMYAVHKDSMKEWLIKKGKWPLPSETLLSHWWQESSQNSDNNTSTKITDGRSSNIFRREGQMWTLCFGGKKNHYNNLKGFPYISYLLGCPFQEFHVLELVKAAENPEKDIWSPSSGEVVDRQTVENYRKRLSEIRAELSEEVETVDTLLEKELEEEKKALEKQLIQAVGIGGKLKGHSSESKRQAKRVSAAIGRSLKAIKSTHPLLWQHLSNAIHRGEFLSYNPDMDISWITVK